MSIREIARELKISRNTVRKYSCGETVKDGGRRGPVRPRDGNAALTSAMLNRLLHHAHVIQTRGDSIGFVKQGRVG